MISAPRASNRAPSGSRLPVIHRPVVEKLVAALGALVTHQIAYLAVSLLVSAQVIGSVQNTDHGHLPLQWAIVAPAAIASVCGFILWQLRSLGFRSTLSVRSMAALVVILFLVQETVEGLAVGRSLAVTMTHPAIVIGVFIAPLVAWAISRLLVGVTELAARLVAAAGPVDLPVRSPRLAMVPVRYRSLHPGGRSRPRAPPSRLRI